MVNRYELEKIRSAILIPEKCKRQCLRQSNGKKNITVIIQWVLWTYFQCSSCTSWFHTVTDLHLISPTYWDFCQICQVLFNISNGAHSVYWKILYLLFLWFTAPHVQGCPPLVFFLINFFFFSIFRWTFIWILYIMYLINFVSFVSKAFDVLKINR